MFLSNKFVFSPVPGGRLELPSLATLVPKTNAYTNSAIPANTSAIMAELYERANLKKSSKNEILNLCLHYQ